MSVRRDPRKGRWYFRARVTFPDGSRDRVFGTPGVPGTYHDLPNTKLGALEAERRAIASAMSGRALRPEAKEVPTIDMYTPTFLDVYSASHKPSTRRDKRQRLDRDILPAVGPLRLDELRQEHVDRITAAMLVRGTSRKQVCNTLGVLSALIRYAVTNKVIADPELSFTIKTQDAELEAVLADDVQRLVEAAPDARYRAAIVLAADAGMRIGEIRALPWIEVNELARELTIAWSYDRNGALTETKGMERRRVPMSDRVRTALGDLERRGPLVFARLDGRPLGYDVVRDTVHEIYARAGVEVPAQPWHSLRHTFGTTLADRGTPIHVIQQLMGHKSIETTLRYMHVGRDAKRDAIAKLAPTGSQRAASPKASTK